MRKLGRAVLSLGMLLMFSTLAYSQPCTDPGSIVGVTTTSSGNYEYVIFKIKKPLNAGFSYSLATVFPPFVESPSDNPVTITGPKYKRIRFKGITWMCEIGENFSLPKVTIKDVKKLEQHEGIVVYVVGYKTSVTPPRHYVSTSSSTVGAYRHVRMKFRKS